MYFTTNQYMKRLYGPDAFFEQLQAMLIHVKALRPGKGSQRISKQFVERIMMAVTEVNGCRYCSYFHTRVAMSEGIDQDEIAHLLAGNFSDAPAEELPALLFAQHYADSGGKPDAGVLQQFEKIYGEDESNQIHEYIRMIMIGNTWGNAFDALWARVKGKPADNSTLGRELGVIFGPFWMVPVIVTRRLFGLLPPASVSE